MEEVLGDDFRDRDILLVDLVVAFLLSGRYDPNTRDCNGAGIDEVKLIVIWIPDQGFCEIAKEVHGERIFLDRVLMVWRGLSGCVNVNIDVDIACFFSSQAKCLSQRGMQ